MIPRCQDSQFPITRQSDNEQSTKKGTNPKKEKQTLILLAPNSRFLNFCHALQPFYLGYLILHEVDIRQLHQMRNVLDMLDLIETQIQTGQVMEIV